MLTLDTLATVTFTLVLMAFGHARFVRIVTRDKIFEPQRHRVQQWLKNRYGYQHWIVEGPVCPWCVGWWTSWAAAAAAWFPVMGLQAWWLYPVAAMALSHAAGYLNPPVVTAGK